MEEIIKSYGITPGRAKRVAAFELTKWSPDEVAGVLDQLRTLPNTLGSNDPCGPTFNQWVRLPIWMLAVMWSIFTTGAGILLPIQLGASVLLLVRGQWKAIWHEIPTPTVKLLAWVTAMTTFVKAPIKLVRQSVSRQEALCVNRRGRFSLRRQDYSVMSHVWGETMGWQTRESWGPVDLTVRKKGISYDHFIRFFDRCGAEWLWVDVLAMPEVLEDMPPAEKESTEELRVGVINTLRSVYQRADMVVVLDTALLRLHTGSMIDVAVVLVLSRWMMRLWPYTESRLAKRVVLQTHDRTWDLDSIINFISPIVNNEGHRYFGLYYRLSKLRACPAGRWHLVGSVPDTDEAYDLNEFYLGCDNRYCDVQVDHARALYPLLDLRWEAGWTLTQGINHMKESFPKQRGTLQKYCSFRNLTLT